MIERAVFLKDAVETFCQNLRDVDKLMLSPEEWDPAETLLTILLPFKLLSHQLKQTKWATIEHVFWSYETLFNQMDRMEAKLRKGREP